MPTDHIAGAEDVPRGTPPTRDNPLMLGDNWGATTHERAMAFPCDSHFPGADARCHRAVDVDAPAAVLFRRLCQLRVAPYSYDRIDNLGRRSPRELTPGLEHLEVGQRFMTVFELVEFEPERHITLVLDRGRRLFGNLAVTYLVIPHDDGHSRLVVRLAATHARGPIGTLALRLLAAADLVMMRRQLLTLKELAERDAAEASTPVPAPA